MSGTTLAISAVIGVLAFCLLGAILAIRFHLKSPEERQRASREMQDRLDKAMEARDDPNEPARWVP